MRPVDFTRNRKMVFTDIICFMLNQLRQSTQTALDRFIELFQKKDVYMSQQSFSEARQKLRWEACRELMDFIVDGVYSGAYATWHGYRVWAIDGSKIQLPSDPKLAAVFGTTGRGDTAATAQSSCLYDVLNDIIADAQIEAIKVDERTLAVRHLEQLCSLASFSKELLILDRGYPSFELIKCFEAAGVGYLMRVRTRWNPAIDDMPLGDHPYVLQRDGVNIPVRVVKFALPNAEVETLITNVFDKRMGAKAFRELYFKRWPIETKFAALKHQLEIENFSGRTELTIRQDYYISAFLSNMIAIAANETQPVIDKLRKDKDNAYHYKVNKNHAVGIFKDRFIAALLEPHPQLRDKKISRILSLLSQHVTPIRPDRSCTRNQHPRQANFHFNQKSNC